MPGAEGRDLAEELYGLLRALDRPPQGAERLQLLNRSRSLTHRLRTTLERWRSDRSLDPQAKSLAELTAPLEELTGTLDDEAPKPAALATLRSRLAPRYEAFAATLRVRSVTVPTLRPENRARSLMHMTSGVIAVSCIELLPRWAFVVAIATGFLIFAWGLEFLRARSSFWNRFAMALFGKVAHPHEVHRINSATWYATALFVLSITGDAAVCALACAVLGFADPAAAFVGRRWGKRRLRAGRSLEGTLAFFAAALVVALAVLFFFHAGVGVGAIVLLAGVAALSGAIGELMSGTLDDNLLVPLAVGASVLATRALLG